MDVAVRRVVISAAAGSLFCQIRILPFYNGGRGSFGSATNSSRVGLEARNSASAKRYFPRGSFGFRVVKRQGKKPEQTQSSLVERRQTKTHLVVSNVGFRQ